jgi:hypothetical protein
MKGTVMFKQIPVQVISFYVSVHPTHLQLLAIISNTLSPYVYDKAALNRKIYKLHDFCHIHFSVKTQLFGRRLYFCHQPGKHFEAYSQGLLQ